MNMILKQLLNFINQIKTNTFLLFHKYIHKYIQIHTITYKLHHFISFSITNSQKKSKVSKSYIFKKIRQFVINLIFLN